MWIQSHIQTASPNIPTAVLYPPTSNPTAARCTSWLSLQSPWQWDQEVARLLWHIWKAATSYQLILVFLPGRVDVFPFGSSLCYSAPEHLKREKRQNTLSSAWRETSGSNGWNKSVIYPQWRPFVWWVCSFWWGERLMDCVQFVLEGLTAARTHS